MAILNLSYIGPSGQTNIVGLIQRLSDGYFVGSGTNTFGNSYTFLQKQIYMPEVSGMPGLYKTTMDGTAYVDDEYNFYVYNSGTQQGLGVGNFWMKNGIETIPSGAAYTMWDEPISNHNITGTFASGINKLVQDIYYADIKVVNNSQVPNNEYGVVWFKNATLVGSGSITNPAISVYSCVNGGALFQNKVMSYASTVLGGLSYIESTSLMVSGIPYEVKVSGTIDLAVQNWRFISGLDYM